MGRLATTLNWLQNHPIIYQGRHMHFVGFGLFAGLNAAAITGVLLFYMYAHGIALSASVFWMLPLGAVFVWCGARAMHLISLGKKFLQNPLRYLKETCFYLQGGIAGAFLWSFVFASAAGAPVSMVWDGLALGTLLGQIFGRIGCFNYGCCFGKVTNSRLGLAYHHPGTKIMRLHPELKGVRVHPAQLYKAAMNAGAFTAVVMLLPMGLPQGSIAAAFLLYHGISRFVFEYFRYDIYIHGKRNWITYRFALFSVGASMLMAVLGPVVDSTFYRLPETGISMTSMPLFYLQHPSILIMLVLTGMLVAAGYGIHGKHLGQIPFTERSNNDETNEGHDHRSRTVWDKSRL
ncbi:prolipoprotein diacylglyceryl transferase [Alkalicoccus chagannorensis]|uniref:prolipoprotein diacylglyceryl transferase n=1 Tax=Alkalicoccus chagannorensis TaxID=427072 RepID=UPI0003F90047|nr:prolipoprotein diacylglyceryl transferase family protein [Alkalicoccus chagannorensis]